MSRWACPVCGDPQQSPSLCCPCCGARLFGRLNRRGEGEGIQAPTPWRRLPAQLALLELALLPLFAIALALYAPAFEIQRSL